VPKARLAPGRFAYYMEHRPSSGSRRNVLVVEDEASIRRLIQASLDPNAYSLTETASGDQAVQLLTEHPFDLVILDLTLEGRDGWDVLRAIDPSGRRKGIRVIILTARRSEGDVLRAWRFGVDRYVMKPFEPTEFARMVDEVLASSEDELARTRKSELEKAELLHLLDTTFDAR
jgi:DNA-binding response OmpR family regulator